MEDNTIKTAITTYFKLIYQEASKRDDIMTMIGIEDALLILDLKYTGKTFKSWIKDIRA